MNNHQVIARKWRPQKFSDVVGQQHVIRTLRNAIAGGRVGHAYLLVGPRGIGKTTIARIFAKAINCENPLDGEPCCECNSCRSLATESSLDVIEIDAASRNSVEHMRALSEEAYHMPVASKYKIYIIDEVHMLSKAAWNALLKTVEEPPSHVKFIFATTEAHLVLPTIVSRCQRFDLRPIAGNLILNRLKLIAESENVKIAPEALSAIARAAEGGMRDAQSSLEQMLAFFGGGDREIAAEQVLELFGLTNAVELDTLIAAMLQNQPGPVVTIVNQLAGRGRNLETLFDDILEMLRGAEFMRILNNPEAVLDFEDEKLERCRRLASLTSPEVLRSFMENLAPVGRVLHEALNKAIYLESILLKAMHEAHAPTVGDILARLNQLRSAGELQFINQVPDFQQQPKSLAMPVTLPEIAPAPEPIPPSAPAPEPEIIKETVIAAQEELETSALAEPEIIGETVIAAQQEELETSALAEPEIIGETIIPATEEPAPVHDLAPHEELWRKLCSAAQEKSLQLPLADCQVQSLVNSVLTVQVPAAALEIMRAQRLQLLSLLQQISGDWAILLDMQKLENDPLPSAEPVYPVPDAEMTAPTAEISEPVSTEEIPVNSIPAAEPVIADTADETEMPQNYQEGDFFIDLNAEAGILQECEEENALPINYNKRSVINNPDEIEKTAQMAPVQKVLDLFGGEIVDIHA